MAPREGSEIPWTILGKRTQGVCDGVSDQCADWLPGCEAVHEYQETAPRACAHPPSIRTPASR